MKPDHAATKVVRRPRWLAPPTWLAADGAVWLGAGEDGKLYRQLFEAIVYELRPKGAIEWIWVNEIVNSQFMAKRFATWQEAMLQFSGPQGVRRAVKNRLRCGTENEDDLEWLAKEREDQIRPTIHQATLQSETFLSRRIEMDSIHRREVSALRRRDLSLRQLDQRRSRKQKEAAQISRALAVEPKNRPGATTEVERVPKKNGVDADPESKTAPEELLHSRNGHG